MTHWFRSDNTSPACQEILQALIEANQGHAAAYGDDAWSRRLDEVFSAFFACSVRVFPVATGTAANTTALATLCPPWGAIVAPAHAHIVRDECGAPEFMTGGARLLLADCPDGRLSKAELERVLADNPANVHTPQPAVVSITQATEFGTVYRPAAIAELAEAAHRRGLRLHMDGARFANAVVSLGCAPADVTWRAGVDVLSFGATKNGALAAEAVIFFDPEAARDYEFRRKRSGHLLSKMRFVSAQLLAYVESGAWHRNAERANRFALAIGAAAGRALLQPVEANEVFLRLDPPRAAALRSSGFAFYDWGAAGSGEYRFVVSWNQDAGDVEALTAALGRESQEPPGRGGAGQSENGNGSASSTAVR
jgi:threonine aldolase